MRISRILVTTLVATVAAVGLTAGTAHADSQPQPNTGCEYLDAAIYHIDRGDYWTSNGDYWYGQGNYDLAESDYNLADSEYSLASTYLDLATLECP